MFSWLFGPILEANDKLHLTEVSVSVSPAIFGDFLVAHPRMPSSDVSTVTQSSIIDWNGSESPVTLIVNNIAEIYPRDIFY